MAYLRHEHKKKNKLAQCSNWREKVKARLTDAHLIVLESVIEGTLGIDEITENQLWRLFHTVSYGLLDKSLYNCVANPAFDWSMREVDVINLDFESHVENKGWLDGITFPAPYQEVAQRLTYIEDPEKMAWIRGFEEAGHDNRKCDPLIGRQLRHGRVLVHDGNGRLFLNACKPRYRSFIVWIGVERNPTVDEVSAYGRLCRELFTTHGESKT